jgi:hypothetical protein
MLWVMARAAWLLFKAPLFLMIHVLTAWLHVLHSIFAGMQHTVQYAPRKAEDDSKDKVRLATQRQRGMWGP